MIYNYISIYLSTEHTNSFPVAKSRTIAVRLISMALTGYYRTMVRPRAHKPLSMLKYDPVGMYFFLFFFPLNFDLGVEVCDY